jgi:hypothetical protein
MNGDGPLTVGTIQTTNFFVTREGEDRVLMEALPRARKRTGRGFALAIGVALRAMAPLLRIDFRRNELPQLERGAAKPVEQFLGIVPRRELAQAGA